MKNKIDIDNCYFHGLAGGIPFWDEERVTAVGMQQLRSIIEIKGIYSRKVLRSGEFSCIDPAFFRYVQYKIGIAINPDIINKCSFREGKYKRLPGERQVLDSIDISNFTAIVIGLSNKTTVIKKVEDILKNTGIPITDINGNILTGTKDIENLGIEI